MKWNWARVIVLLIVVEAVVIGYSISCYYQGIPLDAAIGAWFIVGGFVGGYVLLREGVRWLIRHWND